MFVKICGITNIDDAMASIAAGADALGFNFYRRSSRFIEPEKAREIIDRLPAEILTVGVFVNERQPPDVARVAAEAGVGAVQLHGDESPEFCQALDEMYVIKALRVGEQFRAESAALFPVDAIMLDSYIPGMKGGSGANFNWHVAALVNKTVPKLILAGGLSHENVAEAIAVAAPYGVDACSRLEQSPGIKNRELVRKFVKAAKSVG